MKLVIFAGTSEGRTLCTRLSQAGMQATVCVATEYGKEVTFRKLGHIMETRYKSRSGLEASFDPMWCGMKFYVSLYEAYSDVRLVAAPPESISQFGGEIDNWQWPQHKCDFTLYRVYTAPDGELWTMRKVIRRFLWHDRIHARAMWRTATSLWGRDEIPNPFFFV